MCAIVQARKYQKVDSVPQQPSILSRRNVSLLILATSSVCVFIFIFSTLCYILLVPFIWQLLLPFQIKSKRRLLNVTSTQGKKASCVWAVTPRGFSHGFTYINIIQWFSKVSLISNKEKNQSHNLQKNQCHQTFIFLFGFLPFAWHSTPSPLIKQWQWWELMWLLIGSGCEGK